MEKKVALITGAARGIGRQIAFTLAREGVFVVVNFNGSRERAQEVVDIIKENGGGGVIYQCNVSDFHQTESMVKDLIK